MKSKEYKINGKNLSVYFETEADESVVEEVLRDFDYKICESTIKSSQKTIIDIGAHIGIFGLYVGALNPKVQILCFEPDERNYQVLKQNIKENRIRNVQYSHCAVSNITGDIDFFIHEDSHNHSLYNEGESVKKVRSTTVEKIFKKYRVETCDILKIDAEGAEFEILLNLSDDLWKNIHSVILEYHEYNGKFDHKTLKNLLQKKGYNVQVFPSRYEKGMGMMWGKK